MNRRLLLTIGFSLVLAVVVADQTQAAIDVRDWRQPRGAQNVASLKTWGPIVGGLQAAVGTTDVGLAKDATYHVVLRNTTSASIDICPLPETQLFALTKSGTELPAHGISFSVFQPATDTLRIDGGQTYTHWLGLTLRQSYTEIPNTAAAIFVKIAVREAHKLSQCEDAPSMRLITQPIPI